MTQPLIITTAEQIADLLAPYLEQVAEKALRQATERAGDADRMLGYEEARRITGLGKTRFSQAVGDGSIPHYPNGVRGKLFKMSDLRNFKGYKRISQAEALFQQELANRQSK